MPAPRLVLISPKGPLYRHRGGIFGQGLRYMPMTFPTLAALIPEDVPVELRCHDGRYCNRYNILIAGILIATAIYSNLEPLFLFQPETRNQKPGTWNHSSSSSSNLQLYNLPTQNLPILSFI
jgi:hypothetical protein